jgi:hypothetical protein
LAGVLAGCNATSEAPATANSTRMGSRAPAKVGDLASVKACLRGVRATVTAESATRWKVGFTDGYSVVVQVPKPGRHSVQSVLFGPRTRAIYECSSPATDRLSHDTSRVHGGFARTVRILAAGTLDAELPVAELERGSHRFASCPQQHLGADGVGACGVGAGCADHGADVVLPGVVVG